MTFYIAYAMILIMKNERSPETSFAKKEKIENRLRKTVGMLAIGVTGLGLGLYPWEGRSSAEAPDSPAAVAEQGAVDFVNAAHENPSLLGPEKTFSVDLQDGDSVNSAAQRAAEEVGEQEGWSANQINLNIGVVTEASQEVLDNSEYKIPPKEFTVTMVEKDTNGDGKKEVFPADAKPKAK